ncbi:hypothetical protein DENSPDRAFT_297992 [Dentipellis sp. KUC8613]|nr:hypothetical protein DENSPDRAFT_297992 [Dentipellis sp. KUC8613]
MPPAGRRTRPAYTIASAETWLPRRAAASCPHLPAVTSAPVSAPRVWQLLPAHTTLALRLWQLLPAQPTPSRLPPPAQHLPTPPPPATTTPTTTTAIPAMRPFAIYEHPSFEADAKDRAAALRVAAARHLSLLDYWIMYVSRMLELTGVSI